ncbi:MAG: oligosaccharide flippase family protein [Actinomycetota bacterium]|nr:oligosaccharide flippase family protein [Actinomycetota bacterium]
MSTLARLAEKRRNPFAANLIARVAALGSLATVSLVVARTGGPSAVGELALLRVLPWLTGVLLTCGLYPAVPYFLAGRAGPAPRYRSTIIGIALAAGIVGSVLWVVAAGAIKEQFFHTLPLVIVTWAGVTVLTQVMESTAKACSQGMDDLPGANRVIVFEEFMFLPVFLAFRAAGVERATAMLWGLALGDLLTLTPAWIRLYRRGYFRGAGRPSPALAREVTKFGLRSQAGTLLMLVNERLDFAIVGALVGPAALGIYAIASRFAELLRLPSTVINYVLYPRYAREDSATAAAQARALIPKVGWVSPVAAIPLALAATFVLPAVFGEAFRAAVVPTYILLVGLSGSAVAGIISAYLYGNGRPGLDSLGMGAGVIMTVVLDVLLIPRYGVLGAAIASAVSYSTTICVLAVCFWTVTRRRGEQPPEPRPVARVPEGVNR